MDAPAAACRSLTPEFTMEPTLMLRVRIYETSTSTTFKELITDTYSDTHYTNGLDFGPMHAKIVGDGVFVQASISVSAPHRDPKTRYRWYSFSNHKDQAISLDVVQLKDGKWVLLY